MTARGPLGVGADYGDAKVVGANARRHNPRDAIAGFIGRDAGGLVEYCCGPIEYVPKNHFAMLVSDIPCESGDNRDQGGELKFVRHC